MPPAPIGAITSYGPRRVPEERAISDGVIIGRTRARRVCEFRANRTVTDGRSCPFPLKIHPESPRPVASAQDFRKLEGLAVARP